MKAGALDFLTKPVDAESVLNAIGEAIKRSESVLGRESELQRLRAIYRKTFRNAQQSAVALDIVALMDALKIQKAIIAGFDWGARTAGVMAVLWPERCKAIVSISGYLISSPAGNQTPLPPRPAFAF